MVNISVSAVNTILVLYSHNYSNSYTREYFFFNTHNKILYYIPLMLITYNI